MVRCACRFAMSVYCGRPFCPAQYRSSRFIIASMLTWYWVVSSRSSQTRISPTVGLKRAARVSAAARAVCLADSSPVSWWSTAKVMNILKPRSVSSCVVSDASGACQRSARSRHTGSWVRSKTRQSAAGRNPAVQSSASLVSQVPSGLVRTG